MSRSFNKQEKVEASSVMTLYSNQPKGKEHNCTADDWFPDSCCKTEKE